jgi:TolA-binding protein
LLPSRPASPGSGAASRPAALPGTAGARPTQPAIAQRPAISQPGTRPGQAGGIQRPGAGTRPAPNPGGLIGQGNRPGGGDRPGTGGRPGIATRPTRPGQPGQPGIINRPGGGDRPGITRPGQGGGLIAGNLPGLRPGQRPDRPGQGGGGIQRPDRPDIRPDRPDRPDRPGDNTRPRPRPGGIIGDGNTVINRPDNSNNIFNQDNTNVFNRTDNSVTNNVVVNRPNYGNIGSSGYWNSGGWGGGWGAGIANYPSYYPNSYGNWYSGAWAGWPSYPANWVTGASLGSLGVTAAASYAYSNPFVVPASTTVVQPVYNYSEPIPVYVESEPAPTTVVVNTPPSQTTIIESPPSPAPAPATAPTPGVVAPPEEPPTAQLPEQAVAEDPKVKEAVGLFDEARELFLKGDYAGAQAKVDKAIGVLPEDRVLHEFRALTLFAQKKYQDAATTLYAVMAAGPGWNWDTLKSFYPAPEVYTAQLRALEAHAKENAKAADDRFVLAYHYLTLGQAEAAVKALEQVHTLLPSDQLSAELLKALKPKAPADERPKANLG